MGQETVGPRKKTAAKRKTHASDPPKAVIGWTVRVDFPDWEVEQLRAKVDTGARSSALHVANIRRLKGGRIRFDIILSKRDPDKRKAVTADIARRARVRSSTGEYQERYFVRTRIRVGEVEKEIDLSLVCRANMIFRMLLGRKALEEDFVVDVSHRGLLRGSDGKMVRK